MSQIRNRSSKVRPVEAGAERVAHDVAARAGAADDVRRLACAPSVGLAPSTPAPWSWSTPVTRRAPPHLDQRRRGDPLVEDLLGPRLRDVDERRERRAARVGERRRGTARARGGTCAPIVQVTPSSAIWRRRRRRPRCRARRAAGRSTCDPTRSRRGRASSTTTGMPQRASSSAVVWPTGPLPIDHHRRAVVHGASVGLFVLAWLRKGGAGTRHPVRLKGTFGLAAVVLLGGCSGSGSDTNGGGARQLGDDVPGVAGGRGGRRRPRRPAQPDLPVGRHAPSAAGRPCRSAPR